MKTTSKINTKSIEILLKMKATIISIYVRVDVSGGTDVNKSEEWRKCFICNYYYFLEVNFRF